MLQLALALWPVCRWPVGRLRAAYEGPVYSRARPL